MRQFARRHRRALTMLAAVVLGVPAVLIALPQITGLSGTATRLRQGDKSWLAGGVVFEALAIGGYSAVFRTVMSWGGTRIGWRASAQITLAGLVATKLFSAAGAGGLALTVWALRASGFSGRAVARRMTAFELLLYAVFMGTIVVVGSGLALGVLPGPAPFALTAVPAALAALAIVLAVALAFLPPDVEARLARGPGSRAPRLRRRLATIPGTLREGVHVARALLAHPRPGLLGAVAYWWFDLGALWASLHAFGQAPVLPVVVMSYFLGQLGNALPLPGGLGGVEGGLIGSLVAFGTPVGAAVVGVLAYRLISYWLPMVPGAIAYFRLRRTVAGWREPAPDERRRPRGPAPVERTRARGARSTASARAGFTEPS
jgi:uncharacterized membrane protein YbhN (UPF0104 family)